MAAWEGSSNPATKVSATQMEPVVREACFLHAAPTGGAAWLMRGDPFMVALAVVFVAVLSVVYALSISRVESSPVNRNRRALGLILFVQGIALALAFVKLLHAFESKESSEQRQATKAAAEVALATLMAPLVERISFGIPALAMTYHVALYYPLFVIGDSALGTDLLGASMLVFVMSGLALLSLLRRQPVWALAGYVMAMQVGVTVLAGIVWIVNSVA